MIALKVTVFAIAWALALAANLAGALLGFPVVALLAATECWTLGVSPLGKPIDVWKPRWAWPWSNLEDGVVPPMVVNGEPYWTAWPDSWRAFVWCAWRNKVANLRFTRPYGFRIDPARVRSAGNERNLYLPPTGPGVRWSLAWQGVRAGLWVRWPGGRQFRIGWTIVPADADGPIDHKDLRQVWCGFSVQLNKA